MTGARQQGRAGQCLLLRLLEKQVMFPAGEVEHENGHHDRMYQRDAERQSVAQGCAEGTQQSVEADHFGNAPNWVL